MLVGDYLLSKGLLLCIDHKDFDLLEIISVAVREMSEGELLQIEKTRRLDIDEAVYYEIIRQKTATLIAACCSLGAASIKPHSNEVETMRKFGELIGMAFQIKDDLLDYEIESSSGKPNFQDIKEKKITYPFYFAYKNANQAQEKLTRRKIEDHELPCLPIPSILHHQPYLPYSRTRRYVEYPPDDLIGCAHEFVALDHP